MKSLFLPEWKSFIRYHELGGEGPTLVYLPGLGFPSLINFLSVVTQAEMMTYYTLLVDYLGCGFSDHPHDFDHSIENHARTVAAILDHENIQDCTIVGHSMGGTVGIMVAILRPDLVSRLIVAEGNISPGGGALSSHVASHSEDQWVQEGHAAFLQNMRTTAREGDPFSAFFSGALGTTDPIGFYRSAVALVELEPTFKEKFLQLSLPRTFVYGEKSLLDNAGSAPADVPDRRDFDQHGINVAIVPNAGHGMNFDNLRGFVDVLKAALTASDTPKAP